VREAVDGLKAVITTVLCRALARNCIGTQG
jgi:hypothetical protein